jgi:hypothetical protein
VLLKDLLFNLLRALRNGLLISAVRTRQRASSWLEHKVGAA